MVASRRIILSEVFQYNYRETELHVFTLISIVVTKYFFTTGVFNLLELFKNRGVKSFQLKIEINASKINIKEEFVCY